LEEHVELQTGAASARMDGISNLERVNLLECVSVESRAKREKILQNTPVVS
jgi:hypothetical protein